MISKSDHHAMQTSQTDTIWNEAPLQIPKPLPGFVVDQQQPQIAGDYDDHMYTDGYRHQNQLPPATTTITTQSCDVYPTGIVPNYATQYATNYMHDTNNMIVNTTDSHHHHHHHNHIDNYNHAYNDPTSVNHTIIGSDGIPGSYEQPHKITSK